MKRALLTVPQVAERLAVSRTTVYELIADKTLPSVRIRRTTRIPEDAVERFVDAQLEEGSTNGKAARFR